MSHAIAAAGQISGSDPAMRAAGLVALASFVEAGVDLDERDDGNLRAVDIIVRGADSQESAAAIEMMAEAGFAEGMMAPPSASDMPPMMMACYRGNALMVEKFLELGMPADVKTNAPAQKILKGTPFHAVVLGFREVDKHAYARCLELLLSYCPEGIDLADRLGQRPVDLAVKAAAVTGDQTLMEAMVAYGSELSHGSEVDASHMLTAIMGKDQSGRTASLMAQGAAKGAIRKIERLSEELRTPRP